MFVTEALDINSKGNMTIGGCDITELSSEYGTPLYVMDEALIRKNCRIYKDALDTSYNSRGLVLYAGKAFSSVYMCKIISEEGLGLDVVSGGELFTAMKAEFPAERIYFHGNYKSNAELEMALDYKVGCIVIDNAEELERLNQLAGDKGVLVNVSFRIKPGVEAHTHDFVKTGQIDSKFGVAIENGEAIELLRKAHKMNNIHIKGVHCHIGSQIFEINPFIEAAKVMLKFIADFKNETGFEIGELNLGGGYGIKYTDDDKPVPFSEYIKEISVIVKEECRRQGLNQPFILMEPGRSIVASAGVTLYKVGSIKDIKNVRKYILLDGSMADSPRYALYGSKYECYIASAPDAPRSELVTLAGRTCESGDIIQKDIFMPEIKKDDIIVVAATGAYNYSMSSNYNRLPRPAVVMVNNGSHKVIVKAETYEDIIRNDIY